MQFIMYLFLMATPFIFLKNHCNVLILSMVFVSSQHICTVASLHLKKCEEQTLFLKY